jgi:hypothetical protein
MDPDDQGDSLSEGQLAHDFLGDLRPLFQGDLGQHGNEGHGVDDLRRHGLCVEGLAFVSEELDQGNGWKSNPVATVMIYSSCHWKN